MHFRCAVPACLDSRQLVAVFVGERTPPPLFLNGRTSDETVEGRSLNGLSIHWGGGVLSVDGERSTTVELSLASCWLPDSPFRVEGGWHCSSINGGREMDEKTVSVDPEFAPPPPRFHVRRKGLRQWNFPRSQEGGAHFRRATSFFAAIYTSICSSIASSPQPEGFPQR